jgi:hypothetical protein
MSAKAIDCFSESAVDATVVECVWQSVKCSTKRRHVVWLQKSTAASPNNASASGVASKSGNAETKQGERKQARPATRRASRQTNPVVSRGSQAQGSDPVAMSTNADSEGEDSRGMADDSLQGADQTEENESRRERSQEKASSVYQVWQLLSLCLEIGVARLCSFRVARWMCSTPSMETMIRNLCYSNATLVFGAPGGRHV